jgi:hypothetical protein
MRRSIALLFIVVSVLPAGADDFQSCRELGEKDKQHWAQLTRMDLGAVLLERLRPIHLALSSSKSDSRFQQAEELVKAFDADTWLQRMRELQPARAAAKHRNELEFMFAFWVREKYLGLLARSAARTEQQDLKFFGAKLTPATRDRIAAFPSEPLITRISTFECNNEKGHTDIQSYRCGEPHILVDVQLSPTLLCDNSRSNGQGRLQLIVRLDPLRGPVIVDVDRDSSRIYQTSLNEFLEMAAHETESELFNELKRLAFFKPMDFNEIPGAGILSLRDNHPSNRMPASSQAPHR